jgi:hypothetical protein
MPIDSDNLHMEKITLPDVTITVKGLVVEIRHNKTKMVTVIQTSQLEKWAISQLRKELVK